MDSRDRSAYFETVLNSQDNNEYQFPNNKVLLEVVEEEEEDKKIGDKEQTST